MKDNQITETWSAFVRNAVGELNNLQVAQRIGSISDSTVGNWVNGKNFVKPNAENVVDFARAFGQSIPQALIAAGVVEDHELEKTVVVRREPEEMSSDELLDKMLLMTATLRDRLYPKKANPRQPGNPKGRRYAPRPDVPPM
jgi:hypothetical protein